MKFYLSYGLGDNSLTKEFNDIYKLQTFLEKLCEIKQTNQIFLDGCEFILNEEPKKAGDGK